MVDLRRPGVGTKLKKEKSPTDHDLIWYHYRAQLSRILLLSRTYPPITAIQVSPKPKQKNSVITVTNKQCLPLTTHLLSKIIPPSSFIFNSSPSLIPSLLFKHAINLTPRRPPLIPQLLLQPLLLKLLLLLMFRTLKKLLPKRRFLRFKLLF